MNPSFMYITPETALKQAEIDRAEGNWKLALESLHMALKNRRNKGNNSMLERVMVSIELASWLI